MTDGHGNGNGKHYRPVYITQITPRMPSYFITPRTVVAIEPKESKIKAIIKIFVWANLLMPLVISTFLFSFIPIAFLIGGIYLFVSSTLMLLLAREGYGISGLIAPELLSFVSKGTVLWMIIGILHLF